MFKDDFPVIYKRLCTPDGTPYIQIKDGCTYITNGIMAVILPYEEGETNKDFARNIATKNYDKHIDLPTIKELKAEIKARGVKRGTSSTNSIYMLADGFGVNIFYLLDMLTVCDTTDGYWDGKIISSGGQYVAPSGLFIKGSTIQAVVLPIRLKKKRIEPTYPAPVEKPVSAWHMFPKCKAIEQYLKWNEKYPDTKHSVEGDKVYIMSPYVCIRTENTNNSMRFTNEGYDKKYFTYAAKCTLPIGDFELKDIEATIKTTVKDKKRIGLSKNSPDDRKIMFEYFDLDILLLRDVVKVCGNGTLYWSGELTESIKDGHKYYGNMVYYKGKYGEAMMCVVRK